MFLIYCDVCCLNRPFDDQTQERIRLEAEAVLLILARCQSRRWQLLGSEAIAFEISRIPDEERKLQVSQLSSLAASGVKLTKPIKGRAQELEALGFKALDALHVACAEARKADVLLTTDDRFLQTAQRYANLLKVRVENPVVWLMEVIRDGGGEVKAKGMGVNLTRIRYRGLRALAEALGPVGMAYFLQQFDRGSGDYTQDRACWLEGLTVEEVVKEIERERKQKARKHP